MPGPSSRPRSARVRAGSRVALLLVVLAASARASQDEAAFRERAGRWVARNGVELAEGEGVAPLLQRAFLRIDLGTFELSVPPAAFADAATRTTLAFLARDLVDLEERWCAWSSVDPGTGARARPAAKRIAAWIATWSKAALREDALAGRDLFEVLEAGAPVREASAELRALASERAARLVLLPTREEFVEFAAAAALADPSMRPAFWAAGPELWTDYTFAGSLAIALEFASPRSTEDYRLAISMTAKNPRGLREHVAVLAARSLLEAAYEGGLEPLFAGALANVLVIDLFGELDTRADGDPRAHTTPGRSIFVPGGNPRGGELPTNRADSRWRALQGKDHFVGVLAASQVEGGSGAKERWERISDFALRDDRGESTLVVRAPFLGAGASEPPGEAYAGDYLEFLRAYRVAFLHWLRERAAPGAGESQRRFAALLHGLGSPGADLLAVFERTYEKPLSTADAPSIETSLEGQFLTWLSRH